MEKILIFRRLNKDDDIVINMKEEKIAEFIGIMLGDGCIGIYNCKAGNKLKKQYQLKVTLDSRNKQYTNYVFNLMKEILGIEPKLSYKKSENTVDIRTFVKEKVLYAIKNLGLRISPKWSNMEIPQKYAKDRLTLSVLRGLFDTDGSVTVFNNNGISYPRLEIRLSPCPAQKQVIDIIKKNGFIFTIQTLDRGKIKIRLSGKKELIKWFKDIGSANNIYLDRAKPFL